MTVSEHGKASVAAAGAFAVEPHRERPDSPPPSYGVPPHGGTFVTWTHVINRIASARAYWLGTVRPANRPHVVPIWGVFVEEDLYLETGAPETVKNRNLAANAAVVMHLDGVDFPAGADGTTPADDVVIVEGHAIPTRPDNHLGSRLAKAFAAKYRGYEPDAGSWRDGGLVRIEPDRVLAWADMPTATRWRFTR
jgi:hypothetical protein